MTTLRSVSTMAASLASASFAPASTSRAAVVATRASTRQFSTSSPRGPRSTTKSPYANRANALQSSSAAAAAESQEIRVLPPTKFHPRPHGHHVATLTFKGYSSIPAVKENLVFFSDFAIRAAYAMGIPVSGAAPAKNRKSLWTVLKGPFVHKKAQENFERITSKRVVRVYDANEEVVEKWLHYLRIHSMVGVDMRAEIFRKRPVGFGAQMYAAAQRALAESQERVEAAPVAAKSVDPAAPASPPKQPSPTAS